MLNTNVDGKQKIMFAMTAIRGIGRRFSNIACKKAEVDMRKRWASLLCLKHHLCWEPEKNHSDSDQDVLAVIQCWTTADKRYRSFTALGN